jgi:hypothetical protein
VVLKEGELRREGQESEEAVKSTGAGQLGWQAAALPTLEDPLLPERCLEYIEGP